MIQIIEIKPFNAIGDFALGIDQLRLRGAVGTVFTNQPSYTNAGITFPEQDWFYDHTINVSYGLESKLVERVSIGCTAPFRVSYKGLDIFTTDVPQVVEHTQAHGALDEADPELGLSYIFPELGIDYWRESKAEDLLTDLKDANSEDKISILADIERFRKFQLVSIFIDDYWS